MERQSNYGNSIVARFLEVKYKVEGKTETRLKMKWSDAGGDDRASKQLGVAGCNKKPHQIDKLVGQSSQC